MYKKVCRQNIIRQKFDLNVANISSIYYTNVDVNKINETELFPFPVKHTKAIAGIGVGCWDKCTKPLKHDIRYNSLVNRYRHGMSWENTDVYKMAEKHIDSGQKKWRVSSKKELVKRCEEIDQIYKLIKKEGYLSQSELYKDDNNIQRHIRRVGQATVPNEIRIAIDRDGNVLRVSNGMHRLAIAKIQKINKMPALIQLIHKKGKEKYNGEIISLENSPVIDDLYKNL